MIGDFKSDETLALLDEQFGSIEKSPQKIPDMYTEEPHQEGPRRVILKRAGEVPIVGIAHKMPAGTSDDIYALQLLGRILGHGKSSRFYRRFIDTGVAADMNVWSHPLHDNGLFITYLFIAGEETCEEVEREVLEEYKAVMLDGVEEEELKRAKSQIITETAFTRDGTYSVASNLNEAIALGDWTFYTTFLKNIGHVTKKNIQRVAQTYLTEDQSTTGFFLPTHNTYHG